MMLKLQKILAAAAVVLLAGCMQDGEPLGLEREQQQPEGMRGALRCQVDVRGGNLTCSPQQPTIPFGASGVILGGQGTYVLLQSTNVKYHAGTEVFSADVTVRNLLTQALGTADGETRDPAGVRIFFHTAPAVTGGTGVITVKNADGTGVFTGSSAPYFEYAQVLSPGKVSLPRTWEWNVPSTVETFTFTVYVSAAAPQEDGVEAGLRIEASTISTGSLHACGLAMGGKAYCWGLGRFGRLGDGSGEDHTTPVPVSDPSGARFASISAGDSHTCAVTSTGAVYCWGHGPNGQLGHGPVAMQYTPLAVDAPAGTEFVAISTSFHTCAVTSTGAAYCWGTGTFGQLGNGSTANQSRPVAVNAPGGAHFVSISAGPYHTCAVTSTGEAYCWGSGGNGQLGNGSTANQSRPVAVDAPAGAKFVSISAGTSHTCAVTSTGAAYCWGWGQFGQLGIGTTGDQTTPVAVAAPAGLKFASISAGGVHTCAVTSTGAVYCWGTGHSGRLGVGSTDDHHTPVPLAAPGGEMFVAISAQFDYTCAVTSGGTSYCWGNGDNGKLGNGSTSQQHTPVAVSGVTNFAWLDPVELVPGRTPFGQYARAERALRPLEALCLVEAPASRA